MKLVNLTRLPIVFGRSVEVLTVNPSGIVSSVTDSFVTGTVSIDLVDDATTSPESGYIGEVPISVQASGSVVSSYFEVDESYGYLGFVPTRRTVGFPAPQADTAYLITDWRLANLVPSDRSDIYVAIVDLVEEDGTPICYSSIQPVNPIR